MRLETLSLKGILRFHEAITLDFRELPPGLIAFTGENGAGKTALMESPVGSLYRAFPSRGKELFDYATRADAFIETQFELEGRGLYRARLALDGPHRKAEAVLIRIEANGGPVFLNDGKLSTYDAAIAQILPPLTDVLASVFAAQNKAGSFSALDRKGKRALFASLLGLDRYAVLAERARQAVARLEREIDVLVARVAVLARSAGPEIASSLEQRAQHLQVEAGAIDVRRTELRRQIAGLEQTLADLREAADAFTQARADLTAREVAQRAALDARTGVSAALARARTDAESESTRLAAAFALVQTRATKDEADTSQYDREIAVIETRLTAVREDAASRIAANERVLAEKAAIDAAAAAITRLDGEMTVARQAQREAQTARDNQRARETVLRTSLADIASREAALARARRDAAKLTAAPFGERCAPCAFMTDAAEAQHQIPGLEEAVASKPAAEAELATVVAAIREAHARLTEIDAQITALDTAYASHMALADKAVPLALAQERIAGHQQKVAEAEATAVRERAEAAHRRDQRILRIRTEQATRQDEYAHARAAIDARTTARIAELHAEYARLDTAIAEGEDAIVQAQARVREHEAAASAAAGHQVLLDAARVEWDASTATTARLEAEMTALASDREVYRQAQEAHDAAAARAQALRQDLVDWQLMVKACGPDGLPTLEIDAAGPTVSAFTNDLLSSCYGSRFTVDLITQTARVSKGKDGATERETFELRVYDQSRGAEPRDLSDLSGGERVIVEEAFRCAIALLMAQKNAGTPMRTMFRDETVGALDPDNGQRYIAMLRRVQELGGFHHILFVSHSPDLTRLADAQVQVENGAISIALPPYEVVEAVA